jgi:small subunit ribosomal protein S6
LVIDAEAEEENVTAIVERLSQLITVGDGETGGEVIKVEPRGKRHLAFPINKKPDGQDILFHFHTQPKALPEMERILKLDEQVLRYLIVRADEA